MPNGHEERIFFAKHWLSILMLTVSVTVFYVAATAKDSAYIALNTHEQKQVGAHPKIEEKLNADATDIKLIKQDLLNLKTNVADLKVQQTTLLEIAKDIKREVTKP